MRPNLLHFKDFFAKTISGNHSTPFGYPRRVSSE